MNWICVYRSGRCSVGVAREMALGAWWIACIAIACFANVGRAHAEAPRVLVMASKAKANPQEAEVIDVVRDTLAELSEVRLLPPPAFDFEGMQLALDCSDESARCFGEIATRMEADILIVPRLEQSKDALELRITCFKRGAGQAPAVAMRKQTGARLGPALLDAVPGVLHELLALDEAEPEAEAPEEVTQSVPVEAPSAALTTDESGGRSGLPLGPVLLAGGGVLLLTAGVVVGAIASATEDDYASRTIDTEEKAEAATILRQNGKDQALVANVLLANGAAALIGAGVWYVLVGGYQEEAPQPQARVRPLIGPDGAGLVLSGAWEARP